MWDFPSSRGNISLPRNTARPSESLLGPCGAVMGTAVKADVTVTFGYEKMGSALYPGRGYCGQTEVCDIGFPELSRKKAGAEQFTYDLEDLNRIPVRPAYSNKGTFGK